MHMLFVDESGTPHLDPKKVPYFVLGGVIIPDTKWSALEAMLADAKRKYRVKGEIKWRYFSPSNNRPDNTLLRLPQASRDSLRAELLGHLTQIKSVKLLAVVVDPDRAKRVGIATADELYHFAYKPITERFQYFLQDLSRESGTPSQGIIVADNRGPRDDKRLREVHLRLLKTNGPHVSHYDNLVEGLFIAPSDSSVGIQYADLVAGAVYRSYVHADNVHLDLIRGAFRQHPRTGSIRGYGIVHQPNW